MPQRYLLDTNILSVLIRTPAVLSTRIERAGEANLCTSVVAACELRFGARKKDSKQLSHRVSQLLDVLDVLPLDGNADEFYADVRANLESKGQLIGGNDMLIAAHALQHDCVLVTGNKREFQRVDGLTVENWLAAR